MSDAPLMHGKVPVLPEFLQVGRIPPVVIEVPVSKAEEFPESVEEGVEVDVEEAEPDDVVWQGEFQESLYGETPIQAEKEERGGSEELYLLTVFTHGRGPDCG